MTPSFAPGDKVKVRAADVNTHYRTPYYLRGKRGVVARVFGAFPNPEQLAYHKIGVPYQPLYQIEFDFREVWGKPAPNTVITADIYQHWLERA
ncbi:MAG: SH3-like domain-containing protein [Burkholderiales bacterium]